MKKTLGILILICGIVALSFSYYITTQVVMGKTKVASAQKKVNQGKSLLDLDPTAKELSKGLTDKAQKKIDEGSQEIAQYETLAQNLQYGGIALLVLGTLILIIGKKKK